MDTDNVKDIDTSLVANSIPVSLAPQTTNNDLRQQLTHDTERREIMRDFIKYHLVEGTDYGGIHINKTCAYKYSCKERSHFSKPMLFKPGQDKFMSLMHFICDYKTDTETKEMLGNPNGLVTLICTLYDLNGRYVSRGRGSAGTNEGFDYNKTVKMAQKRARLDAIMDSGILADFFSMSDDDRKPQEVATKQPIKQVDTNGCICKTTNQFHSKACPMSKIDDTFDPTPVEGEEVVGDVPF